MGVVGIAALLLLGAAAVGAHGERAAAGPQSKPPTRLWYRFVVAARLATKVT
jgi:hypothetical protein